MQKDERDLLEVLESELKFLEDGGYARSPRMPWRPQLYIFEDSLSCMNYACKKDPGPCSDCVLIQLVPPEHRSESIPCRRIPFNVSGETLDSLYRFSDQNEIEKTVGVWLRTTIGHLKEERTAARQAHSKQPTPGGGTSRGIPLFEEQEPKCANPACPTGFVWTGGGKFFRFRPDPVPKGEDTPTTDAPCGVHGVKHYWLCESCSHVFTLVYEEGHGVVFRHNLWFAIGLGQQGTESSPGLSHG